jgi:hypothetical protein
MSSEGDGLSLATDIADAVATELNAAEPGTFSQAFTAQRQVLPAFELPDLADLKVTVVPKAVLTSGGSRSLTQMDVSVDIGIQKKLGNDIDAQVAELGTLVDQIGDYLRRRPLAQAKYAAWTGSSNEPVYAPDHLAEHRVLTSVLTVTYRTLR